MRKKLLTIILSIYSLLYVPVISPITSTIKRVALVIGNTNYQHVSPLKNPVNDSQDVADKLNKLDFTVDLIHDADLKGMEHAMNRFGQSLKDSHVAFFFYAGHAIQVSGVNYLIPINTEVKNSKDIIDGSLTIDSLLLKFNHPGTRTNIIILDSCRNNPFTETDPITPPGLARIVTDTPHTLIAYSTQPNNFALDGKGRNSPYTKVLLDYIDTPGLRLDALFSNVAWTVEQNAKDQKNKDLIQSPWVSHSPLPPICLAGCLQKAPQSLAKNKPQKYTVKGNSEATITPQNKSALNKNKIQISDIENQTRSRSKALRHRNYVAMKKRCFTMGSPDDEIGRTRDEAQHDVCVNAFDIAQNEITVEEFSLFVNSTGYITDAEKKPNPGCFVYDQKWQHIKTANWKNPLFEQDPSEPVVCVSWDDAQMYARWLSARDKNNYRLPTEAEWELVASGNSQYGLTDHNEACRYENISDVSARIKFKGWKGYQCTDSYIHTAPIGSYNANDFGIYDTMGNVKEFTCSSYNMIYNGSENKCATAYEGQRFVMRGGSWSDGPKGVRVAKRRRISPNDSFSYAGFRLIRDSI